MGINDVETIARAASKLSKKREERKKAQKTNQPHPMAKRGKVAGSNAKDRGDRWRKDSKNAKGSR